ncbi:DUF3298 domain-containing protein [Conservatibacter flavescens]|uniref:DUF3298 domain-containing protein n=1 Tax=Conservatibacter flavescens TaxID=28161 RepID=A0A2M8S5G8_9PAST|nr:DUF3298 domain-containing protein [Conservatibacter flavescens]PJG86380.1 hypothetical protein CVP05_00795 [Conservatibacter flavescens]
MSRFSLTLLTSLILLTACNDKEINALTERLQQSEQTVIQLKSELDKSNNQLIQLKADMDKSKQNETLPRTLVTKPVVVFQKEERIKFPPLQAQEDEDKNQDQASAETETREAFIQYDIIALTTGVEWLDNILYNDLLAQLTLNHRNDDPDNTAPKPNIPKSLADKKTVLQTQLAQHYADDLADLIQDELIGIRLAYEINYVGQHHDLALFRIFTDNYYGGAHGLYATEYLNVDMKGKTVITLNDLLPLKNINEVENQLWEAYQAYLEQTELDPFIEREDFELPKAFYIDTLNRRIVFVFPLYALAPYVMGEVELALSWEEIKPYLNSKYQMLFDDLPRLNSTF